MGGKGLFQTTRDKVPIKNPLKKPQISPKGKPPRPPVRSWTPLWYFRENPIEKKGKGRHTLSSMMSINKNPGPSQQGVDGGGGVSGPGGGVAPFFGFPVLKNVLAKTGPGKICLTPIRKNFVLDVFKTSPLVFTPQKRNEKKNPFLNHK